MTYEREWRKRQRPYNRGSDRLLVASLTILAVIVVVFLLAGCEVGQHWETSTDRWKVLDENVLLQIPKDSEHTDFDEITSYDSGCHNLEWAGGWCPGWDDPDIHFWHLDIIHVLLPPTPLVGAHWTVFGMNWHEYLTCPIYTERAHDPLCEDTYGATVSAPRG